MMLMMTSVTSAADVTDVSINMISPEHFVMISQMVVVHELQSVQNTAAQLFK